MTAAASARRGCHTSTRRAPAYRALGAVAIALLAAGPAWSEEPLEGWDLLLRAHVQDGWVDYAAIAAWPQRLDAFLAWVASTDPGALPTREEQLAFWINAYNACAVRRVADR